MDCRSRRPGGRSMCSNSFTVSMALPVGVGNVRESRGPCGRMNPPLPHGPRDSRTFPTPTGKAMLTVNELEHIDCPPGRLLLQSMRSHDQFNTTIYSLNDRYRGIKNGRQVIFVNPEDLAELGIADGELVDVHSEFTVHVDQFAIS